MAHIIIPCRTQTFIPCKNGNDFFKFLICVFFFMADSSTDACPPETDSQTDVTLARPGSSASSTSSDDSGTMAVEIPSQRNTEVVLTQAKSGIRKVHFDVLNEHHALYSLELLQDDNIYFVQS